MALASNSTHSTWYKNTAGVVNVANNCKHILLLRFVRTKHEFHKF